MNVVEKVNQILKQANISKVNLAKYLGVSRQMIYNYFDGDDLSKLPNDKCQLLYDLLDVKSSEEILNIKLDNEYLQKVSNKMFSTKKIHLKKKKLLNFLVLIKKRLI